MSHYAVSKVRIKNPDLSLLRQVLGQVAKRLGGEVVENAVVRGWGFQRRVPLLLKMNLPYGNGYGIEIDRNGEVIIHVDEHGAPMTAEELARELTLEYTKLALKQALSEMGYSVEVEEENEEQVVLVGRETGWGW